MKPSVVLGRDALAYGLSKVVPGLASLASVIVFTRMIEPRGYGMYALVFSLGAAAASLFGGWLAQGIIRFQSDEKIGPREMRRAVVEGATLSVLACVVVLAVVAVFNFAGGAGTPQTVGLAGLLAALILVYTIRLAMLQAAMRAGRVALNESIRAAVSFLAGVLFVLATGGGFVALTLGVCAGYAVGCLLGGGLRLPDDGAGSKPHRHVTRRMLKFGFPLSMWLGGSMLLPFLDRSLIASFLDFSQTGLYAAIYDIIVRGYSVCLLPITLAIHARMMFSFNRGNRADALTLIATGLRWQLVIFVVSVLLVALFGQTLIEHALGLGYRPSLNIVLPLTAGGFLWQLALLVHKPLEMAHRTHWMFGFLCVSIVTSVAINFTLLPTLGLAAAGYATLFSGLVYVLLCGGAYLFLRSSTGEFDDLRVDAPVDPQ